MSNQLDDRATSEQPPRELTYVDYFGAIGGDIVQLFKTAFSERMVIVIVTAFCLLIGIYMALFSKEIFQAQAILTPRTTTSSSSLGGILSGRLGALSSLVGASGDQTIQELVISLKSRAILYKFIDKYNIKREMFPSLWDEQNNKWRLVTHGLLSRTLRWVTGHPSGPPQFGPTTEDTYQALIKIIDVSQQANTNIIQLSVNWTEPEKSALWANGIVQLLNDARRQESISRSRARITFLQTQLRSTTSIDMRQVLVNLIQSETENSVVAQSEPQFVLRSLDPAVVPQHRIWPRRGVIMMLSLVIGLLLGCTAALLWSSLRAKGALDRMNEKWGHLRERGPRKLRNATGRGASRDANAGR